MRRRPEATPVGRAPEQYVGHGVLNVRDMGGLADSLFPLRAAVRSGTRTGPVIVIAGPTLNGEQPAPFLIEGSRRTPRRHSGRSSGGSQSALGRRS